MAEVVLETARLELRRPDMGDARQIFELLNRPALMEHLGGPKTLAQIEEKLTRTLALFASEGFGFMLMVERESGELVGQCGIKRVDNPLALNPGEMEIGWLVREDRWRRGYAFEAMTEVLHHAFARLAAPLVVALTAERNVASWSLMRKLGMTRAPELDFADPTYPPEDNPTILYRLTRAQYEAMP
jgi:RimJ/RimL family protein N-acetyltransferase